MLPEGHQNQLKVGFAYHRKIVLFASMKTLLRMMKSDFYIHIRSSFRSPDI